MPIDTEWTNPDDLEATAGTEARSADFNGALGNTLFLYDRPMVAVRLNSNVSIEPSTTTTISWDEAVWDSTGGNMWDSASPSKVLIPRAGVYAVNLHVFFNETVSDDRSLRAAGILASGWADGRWHRQINTHPTEFTFPDLTNLGDGWDLEAQVRQTYDSAVPLRATRTYMTVMWMAAPPTAGFEDDQ